MAREIRELASDIKAKRRLEEVLPEFVSEAASAYGSLALVNLLMEYATFSGAVEEGTVTLNEKQQKAKEETDNIIKDCIIGDYDPEKNKEAVKKLIYLREGLKNDMETITTFADRFLIYEYIMNRLEPKYEGTEFTLQSDDDIAREILGRIFSSDDNNIINEKIREMVSQLPVRMTRGKFTDHISEAFSLYREADPKSLRSFDYMLRSAAGIYTCEREKEETELNECLKALEEFTGDAEGDMDAYFDAKSALYKGTQTIKDSSEAISDLTTVVNAALTVMLTRPYFSLPAEKEAKKNVEILKKLMDSDENLDGLFSGLEGKMELLSDRVNEAGKAVDHINENLKDRVAELMLSTAFNGILAAERLGEGNLYADLTDENENEEELTLEEVRDTFIKDISEHMAQISQKKKRAMMAAVLKELPVFFESRTAVMDYVRASLESCRDDGEKYISVELLLDCLD